MIGMIFDMIGVRDECQHGDAIPVSQQIAECAAHSTLHFISLHTVQCPLHTRSVPVHECEREDDHKADPGNCDQDQQLKPHGEAVTNRLNWVPPDLAAKSKGPQLILCCTIQNTALHCTLHSVQTAHCTGQTIIYLTLHTKLCSLKHAYYTQSTAH